MTRKDIHLLCHIQFWAFSWLLKDCKNKTFFQNTSISLCLFHTHSPLPLRTVPLICKGSSNINRYLLFSPGSIWCPYETFFFLFLPEKRPLCNRIKRRISGVQVNNLRTLDGPTGLFLNFGILCFQRKNTHTCTWPPKMPKVRGR